MRHLSDSNGGHRGQVGGLCDREVSGIGIGVENQLLVGSHEDMGRPLPDIPAAQDAELVRIHLDGLIRGAIC